VRISRADDAKLSSDHAIAEESSFSRSSSLSNGTGEIANREVPPKSPKSVASENALQFHHDQETCKFAGNVNGIAGLHLVSY